MRGREERAISPSTPSLGGHHASPQSTTFRVAALLQRAACGSGEFRIIIQEEHPDGVFFAKRQPRSCATMRKKRSGFVTASRNRHRFYHRRESRHGLHAGQCVYCSTHYLVARFAFMWAIRPKPQLSLSRDLSYNNREPPPGSAGTPLPNRCARARKSVATGFACHTRASHSPPCVLFASVNTVKRGSQLLHKYVSRLLIQKASSGFPTYRES